MPYRDDRIDLNVVEFDDLTDNARRASIFREASRQAAMGTNPSQTFARILEKAFRAGVDTARKRADFDPWARTKAKEADRAIRAIDVPPRGRDALDVLRLMCVGHGREPGPVILRVYTDLLGKDKVRVVLPLHFEGREWGATSFTALRKLGLVTEVRDRVDMLTLSARGVDMVVNGSTDTSVSDAPYWRLGTTTPPSAPT